MWGKRFFLLVSSFLLLFSVAAYGNTLILYPRGYEIGKSNPATMIKLLLYRFAERVDNIQFRDYQEGMLNRYNRLFVISPNGVPEEIKRDIFSHPDLVTCIMGKIVGMPGIKFKGFVKGMVEIRYKGQSLELSPRRMVYEYKTTGKVCAYAYLSDKNKLIPFIAKSGNIYVVSVFALWGDENYVFADVLYRIYGVKPATIEPRAMIVLQDVNPYTDLDKLKEVAGYLLSKSIPFIVSYYPLHYDYYNMKFVALPDRPDLLSYLLYLQNKGVKFVLTGCLRRYYKKEYPRDAEFWDLRKDKPISNFVEYFDTRMNVALSISVNSGIYPIAIEPSEFMFPPAYRKEIVKYFKYYLGQVQVSSGTYKGTQTFPYITFDRDNNLTIVPVNLGYVNKNNLDRGANTVIERARRLKDVGNVFAVFLYHPFVGKRHLVRIIEYLKRYGYKFVSLPFDPEDNPYYKMKFKRIDDYTKLFMKEEIPKTKKLAERSMSVIYILGGIAGGILLIVFLYIIGKIKKNLFTGILLLFVLGSVSLPSDAYAKEISVLAEKKESMVMLVNLLGHFRADVESYLVNELRDDDIEEINSSDLLFFVSDNDGKISKKVLDLLSHRKGAFCFIGNDLYLLLRKKDYPIKYNGVIGSYDYVGYRKSCYFNEDKEDVFSSYSMNGGKVLSYFTDGTNKAVYIGKTGNMCFVTNPTLYGYSIPGLIFADALHDIVGENHPRILRALIRLEDINPSYDDKVLQRTLSYLYKNRLPFAMIFYLIYVDFADKKVFTLLQRPDLIKILREADKHGGTLILHGVTHQYRKVEILGEGSEFWDMEKNAMIPNFKRYFDERMRYAITVSKKYGIPFRAFEAPHYNLPLVGQEMLRRYFPVYVGQAMINDTDANVNQQFPYFIYRSYAGLFIVPENLGYVEFHEEKKSVDSILSRARLLKEIVRDPVAAFFFHPFVGVRYLREVVEGLEGMGYNFVDLRNVIPLYEMPEVEPVSIKNIGLPFDVEEVMSNAAMRNFYLLVLGVLVIVIVLTFAYIFRMYRNKKSRWM